jgi:geranylgeranyl diphosphate synthase type II
MEKTMNWDKNMEKDEALFQEGLGERIRQIETLLKAFLPKAEGPQKVIMEAMEYSLMAGGKRLRPMLMQEAYRLCGGRGKVVEPFMAAIEMIHTYSLVHDDLPAMDDDEYRRNRKTTHIVYGEDMGILAGDALLNYAFETACRAFETEGADPAGVGKALGILAGKSGIFGMVGGQVVDVQSTGMEISGETLDFIYRLKTGALIEASLMVGAVLAGADEKQVDGLESIAAKIGMAFQIQDDILDVESTQEVLGKPTHSDEKNQKTTYVTWKGLERAKEETERLSREAIRELRALKPQDTFLEMLLESLIHRKK